MKDERNRRNGQAEAALVADSDAAGCGIALGKHIFLPSITLRNMQTFLIGASSKVDQHGLGLHGHDASTVLEEQRRFWVVPSWFFVFVDAFTAFTCSAWLKEFPIFCETVPGKCGYTGAIAKP
ncbi:hypothetical protein AK812_SmicGene40538 [Symbiodinium microadriaticum]|uniref:Uncharacterized protein n=1 Tax=Symbiodinium microadriaticum TaxID=2951 RepID=A0A1Q9C8G0_SYMMI|nr:hypothetical protein AK812_SmicGene40538 [Symbiodinium microadriaticum]